MQIYIVFLSILVFPYAVSGQASVGAATWASDGKSFVYCAGSSEDQGLDLFIYNLENKESTQLTFTDSSEWTPCWSPDGKKIAFVSDRDGNRELYVYDLKTKSTKRLTSTPSLMEATPSWSMDSKKIWYVRFDPEAGSREIYLTDLMGTRVRQKADTLRNYIYPRISPSEKWLVYETKTKSKGDAFHVWVEDIKKGTALQLENEPVVSYNARWSSDGEYIIFVHQPEPKISTAGIYRMKKDGSDLQHILSCEHGCFQPDLSPDGLWILYKNGWAQNNKGIYLYNLETKQSKAIIPVGQ